MTSRRRLLGCALALLVAAAAGSWPSSASAANYPNDPYFSKQWGLRRVGIQEAWKTTKGKGITIAIVDTGVDRRHEDLKANMSPLQVNTYDSTSNGGDICPTDPVHKAHICHGTSVAGIAAAAANNKTGIAGAAPEAKIMAVATATPTQGFTADAVSNGVMWAVDHGAKVINLSLGSVSLPVDTWEPAMIYAFAKGALVVVAAGNEHLPFCTSPGFNPVVLCVGASDQYDSVASFSNYGARIDIVAPGTSIWSTCISTKYDTIGYYCAADGTSSAAPLVSGIGALLMSMGATNVQAATILRSSAKSLGAPAGYNLTYGFGRVDAAAAVNLCKQTCNTLLPALPLV